MASSYITKDNVYGFWVDDSLMQVVCWGLVHAIDLTSSMDNKHWLKNEYREVVFDNSQGIFIGFMNLRLDEFLINQERKNDLKEIISETINFFLNKGEYISVEDLNSFQLINETKREWVSPLATKQLIEILNYLDELIDDKIYIKDSDEIDYAF
jgi:hypothetical protein